MIVIKDPSDLVEDQDYPSIVYNFLNQCIHSSKRDKEKLKKKKHKLVHNKSVKNIMISTWERTEKKEK